ncbi:DNA double-strand break repair Rad50 ATPase, putative [Entamoeba histolytica HM-3:IMSS]|uniref:DNA double-strand break repair Rad50 ATPase, putative n=1 Tax=Entamoeba histolytica HM-3:IMSS TaxID=885315 RepID=M7W1N7_ENTHI|nr:DNA double-strand break repair Rad50 ATPase, putative [Entamoeba histolytica HM-3:IMSS]
MAEIVGASIVAGIGFGVFKVICDGVEKMTTPTDQTDKESSENQTYEEINQVKQQEEITKEKQDEEDKQADDTKIEEIIKTHYEKAQQYVEMNNIEGAEEEFILIDEINKKIGEKGMFAAVIKKELASIRFLKEDYCTRKKEEEKRIIGWLNNIYVIEKNKEGIKENFIRIQELIENEKEEIEVISERAIIEHEIKEYEDSNNSCYECINAIKRKQEKKEVENKRDIIEIENQMYYTIIENITSSNKEKERKEEIEECMNQIIKLTKEIKETMLISSHFIKTLSIEEINSIDQIYRNLICKILIRNVGKNELPNEYTLQMNIKTVNGTMIKEGEKIKNTGKKQITMIVTNIENMNKDEVYLIEINIQNENKENIFKHLQFFYLN